MKKIFFFLILLIYSATSQQLEIKISVNKTEFNNTNYKSNKKDPLILKSVLYNRSDDTIILKYDRYFVLNYTGNGPALVNCFRLYEVDTTGTYLYYPYDTFDAFVTVSPNDSIIKENYFTVSWPCRGAPPAGDWNLEIKYYSEINEEDNYYILKDRYIDIASKEMKKAWTGVLSSNKINIKINR